MAASCASVAVRVLGVAALVTLSAAAPHRGDALDELVQLMRAVESGADRETVETRVLAFARAPGAVACYIDARTTGFLSTGRPEEASPLTDEQRDLMELTVPWMTRQDVVQHLQGASGAGPTRSQRVVSLELLGRYALAADLPLLLDLAMEGDGPETRDEVLRTAFGTAVAEIAQRDPDVFAELRWLPAGAEALRAATVRAVGHTDDPQGLTWLTGQLEDSRVASLALQGIARRTARSRPSHPAEIAGRVRPFMRADDRSSRGHAIQAIVALRDHASIPELIAILHSRPDGERRMAHAALEELTGLELPGRAQAWWAWYQDELQCIRQKAPKALEQLSSDDDAEVLAGVRFLSQRGLHRERAAALMAPLLREHDSSVVRGQVCLGLGRLHSQAAVVDLVFALEDEDEGVRTRAWIALRSITDLSLPPDAGAWEAALHAEERAE